MPIHGANLIVSVGELEGLYQPKKLVYVPSYWQIVDAYMSDDTLFVQDERSSVETKLAR